MKLFRNSSFVLVITEKYDKVGLAVFLNGKSIMGDPKNLTYYHIMQGETLDSIAEKYHVDPAELKAVNKNNPAIKLNGTLLPNYDLLLPQDAYSEVPSDLGSLAGAIHEQVKTQHPFISHYFSNYSYFSGFRGTGAPPAIGPRGSVMTPTEYVASTLHHLGPEDEDFFNPNATPYERGAITGIITRLTEYLNGTDQIRLDQYRADGYSEKWAKDMDCARSDQNNSQAGFVTAYTYCAQSYIDGFHQLCPNEDDVRKFLKILLDDLATQIPNASHLIEVPTEVARAQ